MYFLRNTVLVIVWTNNQQTPTAEHKSMAMKYDSIGFDRLPLHSYRLPLHLLQHIKHWIIIFN